MNRCRTKFTWFIGYAQFRCHNYPELCKVYRAASRVFRQTRSPGDFASAFEVSCDFKGEGCVHKVDVQTMNTFVAEETHRHLEWVNHFNCVMVNSKDKWTLKAVGTLRVP